MPDSLTSRVRKLLQDAEFPAGRDGLVLHATGRSGADEETLHHLVLLPEGTYASLDDVAGALDENPERDADAPSPTSAPEDLVADDD